MVAPVGVFRYILNPHFGPLIDRELASMGNQIQVYENTWSDVLEEFKSSPHPTKIAILHHIEHDRENFTRLVDELKFHCSAVFIVDDECHQSQLNLIKQYSYEPYRLFINTRLNFTAPNYFTDCQTWFETTSDFYRKNQQLTQQINYTQPKNINFDILLGTDKPNRRYVYDYVSKHFKSENYLMTFLSDLNDTQSIISSGWQTGIKEIEVDSTVTYSNHWINYNGSMIRLSQIIPVDIYNQTNYSVIAETNCANEYSFYTEKTVKPILGRRLFIMFAGQYYLQNLRSLGFKTFHGIIDESYDKIETANLRWGRAIKEMEKLNNHNPHEVLKEIQPIVEYNYNLMMNTDWWKDLKRDLKLSFGLHKP